MKRKHYIDDLIKTDLIWQTVNKFNKFIINTSKKYKIVNDLNITNI